MDFPKSSVFFMEEDSAIPAGSKPLMLEAVLSCPILKWMSSQLLADGVQRFFVVCSPRFAEEARGCFPAEADVTVSEQQADLMRFLKTPDEVLVFPRGAIPLPEAGLGFVYAAPGYELQDTWETKMTNAVQGARLIPGWIPVYDTGTIAELEPLMCQRGMRPAGEA